MQTVEELNRIQLEVMSGFEWGDPRSKVADTPENREAFEECQVDIAKMKAAGIMPDFLFDL